MSALYNDLSRVYDIVFPENTSATAFLADGLDGKRRILDIACGTGNYSHSLAGQGHVVTGIDLDETMIAAARKKYPGGNPAFFAGDMTGIDSMFHDSRFDLIFCIGNSLVHLPDREAVGATLKKVHGLLDDGGACLVQIVNFDRMIDKNITSLPTIERKDGDITFEREYEFSAENDTLLFNTVLSYDEKAVRNSVRLLAIRSTELAGMFSGAGFSEVKVFGGYDESEHTVDSMATVIRAIR